MLKGRDELSDFAGMVPTIAPGARHLVSNVSIDGDGDDATARLYLQMWATAGGAAESKLVISGRYEDTLKRDDGTLALRHPQDDPRHLTARRAPSATARVTILRFGPCGVHEAPAPRVRLEPLVRGRVERELAVAVLEVDGAAPAVHARARHRRESQLTKKQ